MALVPAIGLMLLAARLTHAAGQIVVWAAVAYACVAWLWVKHRVRLPDGRLDLPARRRAIGRAVAYTLVSAAVLAAGAVTHDIADEARFSADHISRTT